MFETQDSNTNIDSSYSLWEKVWKREREKKELLLISSCEKPLGVHMHMSNDSSFFSRKVCASTICTYDERCLVTTNWPQVLLESKEKRCINRVIQVVRSISLQFNSLIDTIAFTMFIPTNFLCFFSGYFECILQLDHIKKN